MNIIEARGLTKRYGNVLALDAIDLDVERGEIVGFLGPNGAGKSTAIALMLGLRRPTAGSVRVFGVAPTDGAAKSRTGVMLQESGVPETLRVGEMLRLFQSYYPWTLPTDEILTRAGLQSKRNDLIGNLSGGQKQRLYFALAIAGDPDLLFLDEPTVGMDVESRLQFWKHLREFVAAGKTILFSTHYLEEADALANRIVVINKGTIVAQGTPAEIKGLGADTRIVMRTNMPLDVAQGYAGVRDVQVEQGMLTITTATPEAFLRRFFQEDWQVEDLRVERVDLESAFLQLTEEHTL